MIKIFNAICFLQYMPNIKYAAIISTFPLVIYSRIFKNIPL